MQEITWVAIVGRVLIYVYCVHSKNGLINNWQLATFVSQYFCTCTLLRTDCILLTAEGAQHYISCSYGERSALPLSVLLLIVVLHIMNLIPTF